MFNLLKNKFTFHKKKEKIRRLKMIEKKNLEKKAQKIKYEDGTTYEGSMTNGIYNGQGTIKWINGASYKGGWKNGKKDGIGQYTYPDKTTYNGGWKDDLYEGPGQLKFTNGTSYEGNFLKSKFHGKGTLKWAPGVDFVDVHCINDFIDIKNFSWTGEFNLGKPKH